MAELEQNSACSEETNSLCDEERVRKLFQACDGDGDGFIDSQDLLTVCRELNLEDSVEELMKELGADEHGRISYKDFLSRRLALRPEIEALRCNPRLPRETVTPEYLPTSSDNSLGGASGGKCGESWEFDSGARDLSPEPNTLQRLVEAAGCSLTATNTASLLQLANKLHLAALASLRGEILELSSRLHTVTQERDALERAAAQAEQTTAQQYEERLTELHSVIAELSRKLERQRTLVITEEEDVHSETEQSVDTCSQADETLAVDEAALPMFGEAEVEEVLIKREKQSESVTELSELQGENCELKQQLSKAAAELQQTQSLLTSVREDRDKLRTKLRETHHNLRPGSSPPPARAETEPVLKVAERVRLRRLDRPVTGSDLTSLGVRSTEVAEQLVSELQEECDLQELSTQDRRHLELELERLTARLEHSRSQTHVLQLALDETKAQCERLSLLVGKHESNVTAARLALNSSDRAIEVYDLLVSLLESQSNTEQCVEAQELHGLISELKVERGVVRDTMLELESLTEHTPPPRPPSTTHARKLDLETAVLMQELMAMREDKCELRAKIYLLERERENQELKLATLNSQQQAHQATIQHLQTQLCDTDTQELDAEGREGKLRERLKDVASTLERVSRNAELRQKQANELAAELKTANSALAQSLDRCKRKSQARLRRLDTQMLAMVERHAAQVRTLKQRIAALEEAREQQNRQCHSVASETSL